MTLHRERQRSRLLMPAIAVMSRMRVPHKLAVIGTIVALPAAVLLALFAQELRGRFATTGRERRGLACLAPLPALLEAIATHADRARSGGGPQPLAIARRRLDAVAEEGARVQALHGEEIGTRDRWSAVEGAWWRLQGEANALSPLQSDAAHLALAEHVVELAADIGDGSGMILDSELETYYLMAAAVESLPRLLRRIEDVVAVQAGRVRGAGLEDGRRLGMASGELRARLDDLDRGLRAALRESPDLRAELAPHAEAGVARTAALLEALDSRDASPAIVLAKAEAARRALLGIYGAIVPAVDTLLAERAEALARRGRVATGGVLLLLAVAAYMFAAFYRSLMQTVEGLVAASGRMASGELPSEVQAETRDELALVVGSFNDVFRRLRSEWQQAREETARAGAAEALLRESEVRTRAIVESALDAVVAMDGEGRISEWNPQAERTFGWSREEAIGQYFLPLVVPTRHVAAVEELMRSSLLPSEGEGRPRIEIEALRRDGGELPVELAMALAEMGDIVSFNSFIHDITQRRHSEEALREAEARYRSIFENAVEGIFQSLPDGRFLSVNPAMAKIYGYDSPAELIAAINDIGTQVYVQAARRDEFQFLIHERGAVSEFESQIYRRDGTVIWISEKAHAVRDASGVLLYYEGSTEDITERTRIRQELVLAKEAAEDANRSKSQFLATMSHELRTPLNAIIGYSEMLVEEAAEHGAAALLPDLAKIEGAGKHLLLLINDVLDLSKIEAGKMELVLETFDVAALIEELAATVRPLAERNGNRVEHICLPGVGAMRSDKTRVRQVLLNLLSNACKFTRDGRVTIEAVREGLGPGSRLRFRVEDTGIGIPREQLSRLFQPFTQVDASTTREYGGTGLGLVISQRFCQLLDGVIDVESDAGRGSVFTVRLPARMNESPSEAARAETQRPVPPPVPAAPGVTRVLVIDDDPQARDLLTRWLGKEGFAVQSAASGDEGLALARQTPPDAITLDVLMPQMDGWAVLAALKADAALAGIPVVMISMSDGAELGGALGAADFLPKPVDRERLATALGRYRCADPPCRVLVVEDDPAAREVVRRTLERHGWVVAEAPNGREGLRAMEREPAELVLLDLMMPEMDGFEFLSKLRHSPKWRAVPVVVITAKDLTPDERRLLAASAHRVLQKGAYTREQLAIEVRELVAQARLAAGRHAAQRPWPRAV